MKARVLVAVDRDAAMEAIRTLDALGAALLDRDEFWSKKLKRRYKDARRDLLLAVGNAAFCTGLDSSAI